MKTLKLIFTLTIVLLSADIAVYSQTDSGTAFKVDNVSINYSTEPIKILTNTGNIEFKSYPKFMETIYKIQFLSDSIVRVSNDSVKDVLLNINKIEQITVKNGIGVGNVFGGIGLGALFGIGIGAIIYEASKEEEEPVPQGYSAWGGLKELEGIPYGFYGFISGAVIGGIIGAIIPSYESYDVSKFKKDKRKQLEKILRKSKISDSKNF